ncbi:hypothetical protein [Streptomyces sp. SudanB25_2051]|uniref:hypothetical protein n=1 Tax=Streptomyces sp. SudanB25_2051 TaxID=3035275 RepID=UPI003F56B5B5
MSETPTPGIPVGHEAYAFACLGCGYGWEQAYEIEHHTDVAGHDFVIYRADGRRVPSPLSKPTCPNCGRHVVRIMGSGRISVVLDHGEARPTGAGPSRPGYRRAAPVAAAGPLGQELEVTSPPAGADTVTGPEAERSGATRVEEPAGPGGGRGAAAGTDEARRRRRSHLLHPFHRH